MLAGTATAALLANAFVCGVLSNPHDRYGARLVWIAPLVVDAAALPPVCPARIAAERRKAGSPVPLAAEPVPPA